MHVLSLLGVFNHARYDRLNLDPLRRNADMLARVDEGALLTLVGEARSTGTDRVPPPLSDGHRGWLQPLGRLSELFSTESMVHERPAFHSRVRAGGPKDHRSLLELAHGRQRTPARAGFSGMALGG